MRDRAFISSPTKIPSVSARLLASPDPARGRNMGIRLNPSQRGHLTRDSGVAITPPRKCRLSARADAFGHLENLTLCPAARFNKFDVKVYQQLGVHECVRAIQPPR